MVRMLGASQNSHVEILMPGVIQLVSATLGISFGREAEALKNRTSALIKVTQRALLPLLPCVDTVRRQPSVNQKAGSHQTLDLLVP